MSKLKNVLIINEIFARENKDLIIEFLRYADAPKILKENICKQFPEFKKYVLNDILSREDEDCYNPWNLYLINHENLSKTSIEALDWINKHKKYHNLVIAVEFFYKNVLVEMKTHLEVLCGGIDIRPSYDLMYSREIVEKNHEKIKNENYQYFYGLYLDSYLSHFINSQIELLFLKFLIKNFSNSNIKIEKLNRYDMPKLLFPLTDTNKKILQYYFTIVNDKKHNYEYYESLFDSDKWLNIKEFPKLNNNDCKKELQKITNVIITEYYKNLKDNINSHIMNELTIYELLKNSNLKDLNYAEKIDRVKRFKDLLELYSQTEEYKTLKVKFLDENANMDEIDKDRKNYPILNKLHKIYLHILYTLELLDKNYRESYKLICEKLNLESSNFAFYPTENLTIDMVFTILTLIQRLDYWDYYNFEIEKAILNGVVLKILNNLE